MTENVATPVPDVGSPTLTEVPRTETTGEYRIGISFNPSGKPDVDNMKRYCADLIDMIEAIPTGLHGNIGPDEARRAIEVGRLKSIAMTHVEEACRAAVGAITKPLPR